MMSAVRVSRKYNNKIKKGKKSIVMNERRKTKRTGFTSHLEIKRLNGEGVDEVSIEILDISKTGIGFTCTEPLGIAAIYEGYLTIWTKEVLHAFLEIVRIEKKEDTFEYGAIFIGMPEMESNRIEAAQAFTDAE